MPNRASTASRSSHADVKRAFTAMGNMRFLEADY
jgi:hypothetical protein